MIQSFLIGVCMSNNRLIGAAVKPVMRYKHTDRCTDRHTDTQLHNHGRVTQRTLSHFSFFWRLKPTGDHLLVDSIHIRHHKQRSWSFGEEEANIWENNISKEEVGRNLAPLSESTKLYSIVLQGILLLVGYYSVARLVEWLVLWY